MERQSDDCKWNACQLEYLNAVLAMGDPAALLAALAAVARAKGLLRVAEDGGSAGDAPFRTQITRARHPR